MVPWIEREELVSYDEIDDFIRDLENELVRYCCSNSLGEQISVHAVATIAGKITALKELKVIHDKKYKQSIPPDPCGPRLIHI